MTRFLITAAILYATARALAAPPTDAELAKIPRSQIVATVRHLQALQKASQAKADAAELHESETRDRLTFTQAKLDVVESSAKAVEADRDAKAALAEKLAKENKALAAKNKTLSFIVGCELALALLLICLWLKVPSFGWAGIAATVALPVVGFGIVKFL